LNLPEYALNKKSGVEAELSLSTQTLANGNTMIKPFRIEGDTINISGSMEYDKASDDIIAAGFDKLHYGYNNLTSLNYQKNAGGMKVDAHGESFDISPYIDNTQ